MGQRIAFLVGGTLATLLLFLSGQAFGPAGIVGLFLTPFPAAFAQMRQGPLVGAGIALLATVVLILDSGAVQGLQFLALFGLPALCLPALLRRGLRWDRAAAATLLLMVAGSAAMAGYLGRGSDQPLTAQVRAYAQAEVAAALTLYEDKGATPEQIEELRQGGETIVEWLPRLYPGLVATGFGFYLVVLVGLLKKAARGKYQVPGPAFDRWKLPDHLVWVLIAAGFGTLAPDALLSGVALNLLVIVVPLYFLQGLAVVSAYMTRRAFPPFVRGLVFCLVTLINPLPVVVAGVGLFDLWADFRNPKAKKA